MRLDEKVISPHNSMGIKREDMPQISGKDIPEFLKHLQVKGIGVVETEMSVEELKPTQGELETDKADRILKNAKEALKGRIFVSEDGYVLDGHHRWLALLREDRDNMVDVYEIKLNAKEALKVMHSFSKSFKSDIKDKKVSERILESLCEFISNQEDKRL